MSKQGVGKSLCGCSEVEGPASVVPPRTSTLHRADLHPPLLPLCQGPTLSDPSLLAWLGLPKGPDVDSWCLPLVPLSSVLWLAVGLSWDPRACGKGEGLPQPPNLALLT